MNKKLYYQVTDDDKVRVQSIVDKFNELVGGPLRDRTSLILAVYETDFTESTIHGYDEAWHIMENMLMDVNVAKLTTYSQSVREALSGLYYDIRLEQSILSGIFREFEQMGIYCD